MPGTLSALLDEYGYNNAQKIKISGLMNIDDFSTIFKIVFRISKQPKITRNIQA